MLSVENAALTLTLAEQHYAHALKREALMFVSRNTKSVMETDGWKHMQLSVPELVNEVVRILLTGAAPLEEQAAKKMRTGS